MSLALAWPLAAVAQSEDDLLSMPLESLLQVVVSASSREQTLREAPATLVVVTSKQIAERGYQTLEDALRDLPGMDLVHVGGAFPTIIAPRGAWGDENRRILLLIDGVVENSLNGAFELGGPAYSLFGVERVEVLYGPASALYGANAFSGIINLITRKPGEARESRYRRMLGSDASIRDDLYHATPLGERWSMSLAATRFRSDGAQLDTVIPGYADSYVDGALGWNLRLHRGGANSDTVLGVHGSDTPMGNGQFGNTPTEFLGLPPRSPENPGSGGFYHARLGDAPPGLWHPYTRNAFIEHSQRWSERWSARLRLSHRRNGLRDDSHSYSVNATRTALTRFHGAYDSDRSGIELQAGWTPDARNELTVGLQHFENDLERGYRTVVFDPTVIVVDGIPLTNVHARYNPRDALRTRDSGLFAEYQRRTGLWGDTVFTLGARYDRNSVYGSSFNPRLGVVLHPGEAWTAKLLYGSAYRAPTPFELFSSSPVRLPNPDLQPERMRALELSLAHAGARSLSQLVLFHNRLSDVIVEGVPVGGGRTQIQNAAQAEVQGVTGSWEYRAGEHLQLYANATWQDAHQRDALGEADLANVARFKSNAGLQWRWPRFGQLHLGLRHVGSRSTVRSNPLPAVPGYTVADANFSSQPLWHERLVMSIGLRNLADRQWHDPGVRRADGTTFAPTLEQPGRSFWLGLELRL
ncbi:MAG TPA: TonB-dependent receptor [Arenimonas sp.]|nr:TonB-dependent receptor [Arenimonas sp.]